jgi:predicted transcriptional regulator
MIEKTGLDGMTEDDLYRSLNDDNLVNPRINDLLREGMVYLEGSRYRLTQKGKAIVRIFISYRRLLKVSKGG